MKSLKKYILEAAITAERINRIENNFCPNCNRNDLDWEPMLDDSREVHCNKCNSNFNVSYNVEIRSLEEM